MINLKGELWWRWLPLWIGHIGEWPTFLRNTNSCTPTAERLAAQCVTHKPCSSTLPGEIYWRQWTETCTRKKEIQAAPQLSKRWFRSKKKYGCFKFERDCVYHESDMSGTSKLKQTGLCSSHELIVESFLHWYFWKYLRRELMLNISYLHNCSQRISICRCRYIVAFLVSLGVHVDHGW